ncbi:MAG: 6-phosphogluconolactonase [Bacteroidetes bacterium]|nr:6-phosphogluconolactonase [Bacteroidota bacterium]MCW5894758.1 6-phosphogluconolactonase [Bacteroidota bacterium]
MNTRVLCFESAEELHRATASDIIQMLNGAIRTSGQSSLMLSGGTTPGAVYRQLASKPLQSQLDWRAVHVFWGDERCVPPTEKESNYRMAYEALLGHVPIPDQNIHRIRGELTPTTAAEKYEQEIREFFSLNNDDLPRFDVTLLGLGEDGHTASLFPETTILNEASLLVANVYVPKLDAQRISVTYPVLNNSGTVTFIVTGGGKASILRDVLEGDADPYPAGKIRPRNGSLFWYIDRAAGSKLRSL